MDPRNKHHLKAIIIFLFAYFYKTSILGENYGFILGTIYNLLVIWVIYMYEMNYEQPRVQGGRDFEVCIVGAGFSGIGMAVRLKQMGIKFRIIEKSEKLGGTWWDNKYPGCACDIPSHLYRYGSQTPKHFVSATYKRHCTSQLEFSKKKCPCWISLVDLRGGATLTPRLPHPHPLGESPPTPTRPNSFIFAYIFTGRCRASEVGNLPPTNEKPWIRHQIR